MAHPRIVRAFRTMKYLGITEEKVKPALKRLLKMHNKNWDLIEEDNYRHLLDAIFDSDEPEAARHDVPPPIARDNHLEEEEVVNEEPERPLKRHRLRQQDGQAPQSNPGGTSQPRHDVEGAELVGHLDFESQPELCQSVARNKGKQPVSSDAIPQETHSVSHPSGVEKRAGSGLSSDKGKEVLSPHTVSAEKKLASGKPSSEPSNPQSSNKRSHGHYELIKPKEEPFTQNVHQQVPVSGAYAGSVEKGGSSNANVFINYHDHPVAIANGKPESIADKSYTLEIASSTSGEVKVIINCGTDFGKSDFQMPSLDAVVKSMEEKCLSKYKDFGPNFPVLKVMQHVCQCFLELGANPSINSFEATTDE